MISCASGMERHSRVEKLGYVKGLLLKFCVLTNETSSNIKHTTNKYSSLVKTKSSVKNNNNNNHLLPWESTWSRSPTTITILADDIGELGTGKLAPRSLQLSLLPHPASSSAAAAAAPARTDKVGKTDPRTQFKFSRSFAVPFTCRFTILPPISGRGVGQAAEKLIRIKV